MTKTKQTYEIGQEIAFDEAGYKRAISQLSGLVPLANDFANVYQQLTRNKITEDVFMNAMASGTGKIAADHAKNHPEKLKLDQLPAALRDIAVSTDTVLINTLNALRDKLITRKQQLMQMVRWEAIDWSDLSFNVGAAVIKEDSIRERYVSRILNDQQINLLEAANLAKEGWDKLVGILADNGYDMRLTTIYEDVFFEDPQTRTLTINLSVIDWIK